MESVHVLSVRLPYSFFKQLRYAAVESDVNVSDFVREVLEKAVEEKQKKQQGESKNGKK